MVVLDATAVLELLLARPDADSVSDWMIESPPVFLAPGTRVAVLDVLREYRDREEISEERALIALNRLARLLALAPPPADFVGLVVRAWGLREQAVSDVALAAALAEELGASLLTCDRELPLADLRAEVVEVGQEANHPLRKEHAGLR
ncbi:MAG: hypothetical protein AAGD01_06455 [Acidobacteriota bacterium]